MSSKLKIAIIGSGSTYTPELIEGILKRKHVLPVTELVLMDIDKRLMNPLVGDYNAARACFDELKEAHKAYLPQFFKEN